MSDANDDCSAKAQRLRIRFARGPEAAELGHLDLARTWERALESAGVPISRSGARRQARLTLAAGLPMGVTSEGELLDVVLAQHRRAAQVFETVAPYLPAGLAALEIREVGMGLPSLPSSVRYADFEVDARDADASAVGVAVDEFLEAEEVPWVDTRGEKERRYDLRQLVHSLRVEQQQGRGAVRLVMRLRCDAAGVGRPDQVAKALGLPEPVRIHRKRLVVTEVSPARDAWRRRGRLVE